MPFANKKLFLKTTGIYLEVLHEDFYFILFVLFCKWQNLHLTDKMSIKWVIFDAMGVIFEVADDITDLLVPFIQSSEWNSPIRFI